MKFDSGRLEDLKNLERELKSATNSEERQKYQSLIDGIKRQSLNVKLSTDREHLMEARRQGDRESADKLEESIYKQYGA